MMALSSFASLTSLTAMKETMSPLPGRFVSVMMQWAHLTPSSDWYIYSLARVLTLFS